MTPKLPSWSFWLWLGGFALWFGILPILVYDGRLYYAEGGQSPDAPGMLLMASAFMCIVMSPVFALLLALFLVRYKGGPILVWRTRSWVAIALSVVAMVASGWFVFLLLWRTEFWLASRLPFVFYNLAGIVYFQLLRAAAVNRGNAQER